MQLHLPTVLLYAGLLMAVIALGLSLLAWRDRRAYLWHWSLALVSTFTGLILYGLRGATPGAVGVVLANLLLLGNLIFTISGYQRLFGQPVPWRWLGGVAFLQALAYLWFSYVDNDYPVRVIVFNTTMAALSLACAGLLWQQRRRLGWALLALPVGAHLLQVGLGVARVSLTLQDPVAGGLSLQVASQAHVIAIMLSSFASLALAFGFLALHAGHLLEELDQRASTDPLTGLANRRGFEPAIDHEWQRHRRLGTPLSLLVIDIDHFKQINDRHGHAAGDAALRHLGMVLRQHLRPYDRSARLGGEEFCVVLSGAGGEEAKLSAERLRKTDLCFGRDALGEPMTMTLSIGIAVARASDANPQQLLARADAALYLAKAEGRDRVVGG